MTSAPAVDPTSAAGNLPLPIIPTMKVLSSDTAVSLISFISVNVMFTAVSNPIISSNMCHEEE